MKVSWPGGPSRVKSTLFKVNARHKPVNRGGESGSRAESDGAHGDGERPRPLGSSSALNVGGNLRHLGARSRCGRSGVSSVGAHANAFEPLCGIHRRSRRHSRRERVRVAHGGSTASTSRGHHGGVPAVHVHGAGPSREGSRSANRACREPLGEGPRHLGHALARIRLWRAGLPTTRVRADEGDATHPHAGAAATPPSLPKIRAATVAMISPPRTHASLHIRL